MERARFELLPGVFLTAVRTDAPRGCFRAALLRQLSREEAAMNALLPDTLLQGTQAHPSPEALSAALASLGCDGAHSFVRKLGEIPAVGYAAAFENDEAAFPALMRLMSAILLQPDTRFGQLKKEAVAAALKQYAQADEAADPFAALIEHMCCYEDYGLPVRGEDPEAGPNYYQKLSRHYRAVLSAAPLELFYAGAVPPKQAAQVLADCFAAMPRGEPDFELGTDIRMNAVEAEPRVEDHSGPQGACRVAVGWRLGEGMEEPDVPALEAMACVLAYLTRGLEPQVRLDVHKGLLLAACETDGTEPEAIVSAFTEAMEVLRAGEFSPAALDEARRGRIAQLRAAADDPAALERFWLEQDLLGLELAPDEYAAFTQEAAHADVVAAAQGVECDAVLIS